MYVMTYFQRLENNILELVLSFQLVGLREQTQVIRLSGKPLYRTEPSYWPPYMPFQYNKITYFKMMCISK